MGNRTKFHVFFCAVIQRTEDKNNLMKAIAHNLITLFLLLTAGTVTTHAQQALQLRVASFEHDALDTSCQTHKQYDDNGDQMAIVKVTSSMPGDDLTAYQFDFHNMRHDTEGLHDGELWLYVQRNARFLTISRKGYATIRRYELTPAIDARKVYRLQLSGELPRVYTQMVQFAIQPKGAAATIMVKSSRQDAQEEVFAAVDPVTGLAARSLPYGTYTYRVLSNEGKYHPTSGRFTLNDKQKTHTETVALRPNFSELTLQVDADADIYINDELKGRRSWTGTLKAGNYTVECRQKDHHPSSQYITVVENDNSTVTLTPPTPITGTLSVTSLPQGATITIDGHDYGTTPRQINDLNIGFHRVTLSKANYQSDTKSIEIKEDETTQHSATLSNIAEMTITSSPTGASLYINGEDRGTTPFKGELASGDYQLRLTKPGYLDFSRRVHLDSSHPQISFTLSRQLVYPTCFYLQAGLQAGSLTAVEGSIGGYISNVNVETSYNFSLGAGETIWWNYVGNSSTDVSSTQVIYKPMTAALRAGYGIIMGTRLRLTPQAGARHLFVGSEKSFHATSALVGLRAEYALMSLLSIYAAPELAFAVNKSDDFDRIANVSDKVKSWATGFNIRLGLSLNF